MKILIATTNPGKLSEVRAVMAHRSLELIGLANLDRPIAEPDENGATFEANAIDKARYYAAKSGLLTLADDSGLEVEALNGAPGVRSARYSGAAGPRERVDQANNAKLLRELAGVPAAERSARFVCAMAAVMPLSPREAPGGTAPCLRSEVGDEEDVLAVVRGVVEGRILTEDEAADPARPEAGRGSHGFGYDPLFLVRDAGRTTAEMTPQEKNAISHRGRATRAMGSRLRSLLGAAEQRAEG